MKDLYYFAYGSNMDEFQMEHRCPFAIKEAVGFLPKHKLCVSHHASGWGGGVFSIKDSNKKDTFGVVYNITPSDLDALDLYEGYPTYYRREIKTIHLLEEGKKVRKIDCIVYVSNFNENVKISEKYYDFCLEAANEHNIKLSL